MYESLLNYVVLWLHSETSLSIYASSYVFGFFQLFFLLTLIASGYTSIFSIIFTSLWMAHLYVIFANPILVNGFVESRPWVGFFVSFLLSLGVTFKRTTIMSSY